MEIGARRREREKEVRETAQQASEATKKLGSLLRATGRPGPLIIGAGNGADFMPRVKNSG